MPGGLGWLSLGFAEAVQAARRQQEKKEELCLESTTGPGVFVGSLQYRLSVPGKQKKQKRSKRSRHSLECCSWPMPSLSEPKEEEEKVRKEQQRELAKQKAQEQATRDNVPRHVHLSIPSA